MLISLRLTLCHRCKTHSPPLLPQDSTAGTRLTLHSRHETHSPPPARDSLSTASTRLTLHSRHETHSPQPARDSLSTASTRLTLHSQHETHSPQPARDSLSTAGMRLTLRNQASLSIKMILQLIKTMILKGDNDGLRLCQESSTMNAKRKQTRTINIIGDSMICFV